MNLYLTALDLSLEGVPSAALARVSTAEGRACKASSDKAADYLRGRYTLPLQATIQPVEWIPATGSTATAGIEVALTDPDVPVWRAYGIVVQVLTTTTAKLSLDGGLTWSAAFTITPGDQNLQNGLTLTWLGGTWYVGDVYRCSVSYGSLTSYCVQIAAWNLLRVRGVAPDGNAYEAIKQAHADAVKWLISVRDLGVDPGLLDSRDGDGSGMFLMDPEGITGSLEQDRRWNSCMGRDPDVGY